jgi:hypothetical protein
MQRSHKSIPSKRLNLIRFSEQFGSNTTDESDLRSITHLRVIRSAERVRAK